MVLTCFVANVGISGLIKATMNLTIAGPDCDLNATPFCHKEIKRPGVFRWRKIRSHEKQSLS